MGKHNPKLLSVLDEIYVLHGITVDSLSCQPDALIAFTADANAACNMDFSAADVLAALLYLRKSGRLSRLHR